MRSAAGLATAVLLSANPIAAARAQSQAPVTSIVHKEEVVKTLAKGTFEVKVLPLAATDNVDTGGFGRMALDKRFSGDLAGTSRGQMLAAGTAVEGSGAYVALERVTGTLNGRRGSFILQHNGTMGHGKYEMKVTVVPDSGTEELTGLSGTMKIIIEGGKHSYEFEYSLGA